VDEDGVLELDECQETAMASLFMLQIWGGHVLLDRNVWFPFPSIRAEWCRPMPGQSIHPQVVPRPPQQPTISIRSTDHIHYAARGSMKVGCDDTLGRAQRCQLHRFITSAGDLRRRGCSGASWTA